MPENDYTNKNLTEFERVMEEDNDKNKKYIVS